LVLTRIIKKKGDNDMKLLKIDNDSGYFLDESGEYQLIDNITKEHLLRLVDLLLSEDVEFDEYRDEQIRNQAHQIIYKSIYEKLVGLRNRKQEFIDESARLYLQEYEKYNNEASQQGHEAVAENGGAEG